MVLPSLVTLLIYYWFNDYFVFYTCNNGVIQTIKQEADT